MARPQKWGLDYFPFDVDFFEDAKLSIIRNEFGSKGEIVAVKLLCAVYHEGYYMEWNEQTRVKLYASVSGLSAQLFDMVVNSLVKWGFFDKTLFDSAHVLTSHGIQKRYFAITRRRVRPSDLLYLLPDVLPKEDLPKKEPSGFMSAETPRKESKGKDNNSQSSSLSPSPSSPTTPSRVSSGFENQEGEITARRAVEILKGNRDWLLQMQRRHGVVAGTILNWLDAFVCDCDCRGKQNHADLADVMQHFNDWLTIQLKMRGKNPKKGKKDETDTPSDPPLTQEDFLQRWIRCQAEISQNMTYEDVNKYFSYVRFESFQAEEPTLTLQAPSGTVFRYLDETHGKLIYRFVSKYFGRCKIQYRIIQS